MPIELPAMPAEQQEAWQAVFEIHDGMPHGWVLVGGKPSTCTPSSEALPSSGQQPMLTSSWTSAPTRRCSTTSPHCF